MICTRARAAFAGALLVAAAACSLPDLGPFADVTAEIHAAAEQVGDAVESDLERLALLEAADEDFAAYPARFRDEWEPRLDVLGAMVEYADSLAGIVDAASAFGENARSLAGSLGNLLDVAGVDPTAVLSEAALQTVVVAGEAAVTVKAHRDLARAVAAADPAVQAVARILDEDLAEIGTNLLGPDGLPADVAHGIRQKHLEAAGADLAYRRTLLRARQKVGQLLELTAGAIADREGHVLELRARIVEAQLTVMLLEDRDDLSADQQADLDAARATLAPDGAAATIAKLEASLDELVAAMGEHRATEAQVESWLADTDAWYRPMTAEVEDALAAFEAQRATVGAARDAARAWALVHAGLAESLREDRRPNLRLILTTAERLRAIRDGADEEDA